MSAFINEISAALQDDLANREVWIEASVELVAQTEKSVVGKLLDQSSNAEKCENSANDRPILPTINRKNIDMNLSETENLASELPHGFSQINLDSKNKSVDSTDSVEVLDTECTGSSVRPT